MHEFSRPLGEIVKATRIEKGMTQKQLADILNIDERTIMNIEKYRSNPTLEVLYPLIRALNIDSQEIFYPELSIEKGYLEQVKQIITRCSEKEIAVLAPVMESVLKVLRSENATEI